MVVCEVLVRFGVLEIIGVVNSVLVMIFLMVMGVVIVVVWVGV